MNTNNLISVVAPMYNEEASIAVFITRTIEVLKKNFTNYELVLIDDGSQDNTFSICKAFAKSNKHIRVIAFSRNYGHEIALTAGIEHAAGDYVVLMDSDLQNPPETILEMMEKIKEGYDIVYAERSKRKGESWLKQLASKLFYKTARKMTGFDLPNNAGNFRIFTRKVAQSIIQLKENNRHLMMIYAYLGFKSASIPYTCEPRYAGKSNYNYSKLFNLALDSIISFSHKPLRYMSIGSLMISGILALYAGFIVLDKLFYHQHLANGIASIILIMSGLFSVLFLFLAVISEYIGRILVESKNRPLYYIREEHGGMDEHGEELATAVVDDKACENN